MPNYAGTCKGICSCNVVYNFLIQLLPLENSVFVVYVSNAFWYRNKAFPEGSSQNEVVFLLITFHLSYSKYNGGCENMFSLMSLSTFFTRVALVPFVQHSCCTHIALVSLMLHSCRISVARVWHSSCKLDQIFK